MNKIDVVGRPLQWPLMPHMDAVSVQARTCNTQYTSIKTHFTSFIYCICYVSYMSFIAKVRLQYDTMPREFLLSESLVHILSQYHH